MSRTDGLTKDRRLWQKLAQEVVVERRQFSKIKWLPHFRRLQRAMRDYCHVLDSIGAEPKPGHPDPRELLVWAWCVLMAAPENVGQEYAHLPESTEDAKGLRDEAAAVRARGYAFKGLETSPEMQMRWVGGLVRAIDGDLAGIEMLPRASGWTAHDWRLDGYSCYVVPVRRPFRGEDHKERARRATLLHAIVPAALGDLEVVPVPLAAVARSGDVPAWRYGAAAFDGLTIEVERIGSDRFRLVSAPLAAEQGVISAQISGALDAACDVLLWPELTVPADRLAMIQRMLADDPLRTPDQVALIAAGSWHLKTGHAWVNRTTLLQGRGRELETYDKRRRYPYDDHEPGTDVGRPHDAVAGATRRFEAITPGTRLVVVVAEDRLASVAICRDFCDDCADDVYDWLGVDVVIVPSMGDHKTMDAHQRGAKGFQSQQGATTFIVQQVPVVTGHERPEAEPPAYSLAAPPRRSPQAVSGRAPRVEQMTVFRMLEARR